MMNDTAGEREVGMAILKDEGGRRKEEGGRTST